MAILFAKNLFYDIMQQRRKTMKELIQKIQDLKEKILHVKDCL